MSNNAHGKGYDADLSSNMQAFDQLPRTLRVALAQSDHNWSARQCLRLIRAPKAQRRVEARDARTLARTIVDQDLKKHRLDAASGLLPLQR